MVAHREVRLQQFSTAKVSQKRTKRLKPAIPFVSRGKLLNVLAIFPMEFAAPRSKVKILQDFERFITEASNSIGGCTASKKSSKGESGAYIWPQS